MPFAFGILIEEHGSHETMLPLVCKRIHVRGADDKILKTYEHHMFKELFKILDEKFFEDHRTLKFEFFDDVVPIGEEVDIEVCKDYEDVQMSDSWYFKFKFDGGDKNPPDFEVGIGTPAICQTMIYICDELDEDCAVKEFTDEMVMCLMNVKKRLIAEGRLSREATFACCANCCT